MALKFKTDRPPVAGCSFAVVQWSKGGTMFGGKGPGYRYLVSCQRTIGNARKALAMAKENDRDKSKLMAGLDWLKMTGKQKFAIYNVKTGKRVK